MAVPRAHRMRGRVTSHATRCTSRVHLAQLQGLSLRLTFRSEISGLRGTKPTLSVVEVLKLYTTPGEHTNNSKLLLKRTRGGLTKSVFTHWAPGPLLGAASGMLGAATSCPPPWSCRGPWCCRASARRRLQTAGSPAHTCAHCNCCVANTSACRCMKVHGPRPLEVHPHMLCTICCLYGFACTHSSSSSGVAALNMKDLWWPCAGKQVRA